MIKGLIRCPSSYFDVTPTGQLTNKFSNDLGMLDTGLGFVALDSLEGPIISLVMMGNIFAINPFFIIPGVINIVFLLLFFTFSNESIINAK